MFAGALILSPALLPESVVDADAWRQALAPLRSPDRHGLYQSGPAWLMEQRVFNDAANRDETVPLRCTETGVALAFWGRLDNRRDLLSQLAMVESSSFPLTDAQLVLAAWRRWGEAMPERLLGDFALAVLDPVRRRAFLARDPLGVKPLYYRLDGQVLAFATTVAALKTLKGLPLTPDPDWMAHYLLQLSTSNRQTAYREIVKLPPGHSLTVDAEGREQLRSWFAWRDDAPPAIRREARWVDAYRDRLEEAIRCRMASDYPLGTENSGGIDSATITAYLAHFLGEPGDRLHSFGFALCEQEPAFILETSQAKRIVHNYVITTHRDDDARIVQGLQVLGYPEEHNNGTGHTPFYQECAQRGIRALFSGFGGDEVVTNPGHHLRLELLDEGRYDQLWGILPGDPLRRLLRLGKVMTLGRKNPEYNTNFFRAWNTRWPHQVLRDEVVERLDIHRCYMETARHDAPYRQINTWIIEGLLTMPYIATRLENCTLMAAAYGIDYRWPLWDVRLVQQYLSTPSIEKVGPKGIGRYLHRRAIDAVVPKRVAWKSSKDMGYAAVIKELNDTGLIKVAEQARRQEAHLHPALAALIDREKYRQQIARAAQGKADQGFAFSFRQQTRAIRWLNHWLHGEVPPG
ncbi:MAG: asparagine synthase-related protein [Methylobacter sp.]